MALKEYAGAAPQTRLASPITIGGTTSFSVVLGGGSGYPTGTTAPFVVVIDRGTALEEKILVDSRTNETFSGLTRGYDGTTAQAHSAQAIVEHVWDAASATEANLHTNDDTRDDHSQYLNPARHDISARHPTTALADNSVTGAKIEESHRWMPGDLKMTTKDEAQTGWLLCNGAEVLAATYPDLATELGTGAASRYGVAATGNIKLPDLRQRFPMGVAASGLGNALGANGGTKDLIAATHTHTINNHTHSGTVAAEDDQHTHSLSAHQHWNNLADVGDHQHDTPNQYVITSASGGHNVVNDSVPGSSQFVTFTDLTHGAGAHNHDGWSDGPNTDTTGGRSAVHDHTYTTGNPSDRATDAGTSVSGTDKNIPPFVTVNFLIKT
jgi:microcystin-dependent protein